MEAFQETYDCCTCPISKRQWYSIENEKYIETKNKNMMQSTFC